MARQVAQLPILVEKLHKDRVACHSRVVVAEERLREVNLTIENLERAEEQAQRDLMVAQEKIDGLVFMRDEGVDEERSLMRRTKGELQSANRQFSRTNNSLARKEREALLGFSLGRGTTCTVKEAQERTKMFATLRKQCSEERAKTAAY